MSDISEIKQHLDHLTRLSNTMKEQAARLSGPEGDVLKKKAKKEGTSIGIGAGVSFLGLLIVALASVYILAVIILLVNIALDRLWLSALIVVVGSLLIGGGVIAIGVSMARSSAKELSKATEDIKMQFKRTGEEMKAELDELQSIFKKEAAERRAQVQEMAKTAKSAAPVLVPAAIGAILVLGAVRKRMKARKEKKYILKIVGMVQDAQARR